MVRLHLALTVLLTSSAGSFVDAFHPSRSLSSSPVSSITSQKQSTTLRRGSTLVRPVASTSPSSSSDFEDNPNSNLNSLTNAAVDFVVRLDEPDLDAAKVDRRREMLQNRNAQKSYKVTLPLASSLTTALAQAPSTVLNIGISLCQITKGRKIDSSVQLNLDSLELEEYQSAIDDQNDTRMNPSAIQRRIDGEFQGLVVASVEKGSAGWAAGVRPGDILKTSSATLGSQLWPKSTLEGVKSALTSRKAVSESVQFEFQRLGEIVDNQFELTLTRPIGLELKGTTQA
jgi:hypothetical protein